MFFRARNDRGFSVIELMMVVLMIGTLAAIALPVMKDMTASIKLNEAARMVEREMQDARLEGGVFESGDPRAAQLPVGRLCPQRRGARDRRRHGEQSLHDVGLPVSAG